MAETGLGLNRVSKVSVLDWENDLSQSLLKQFQWPIEDTTSVFLKAGSFSSQSVSEAQTLSMFFPSLAISSCPPPPPSSLQHFLLYQNHPLVFCASETSDWSTTQSVIIPKQIRCVFVSETINSLTYTSVSVAGGTTRKWHWRKNNGRKYTKGMKCNKSAIWRKRSEHD